MTKFRSKQFGVINTKKHSSSFLAEMGRRGGLAAAENRKASEAKRDEEDAHQSKYHEAFAYWCSGLLAQITDEHGNDLLECDFCGKQTEI